MNKSIIVYGPQGCGKTVNAERIRTYFGLERIVDDFVGVIGPAFHKGILYLTCYDDPGYKRLGIKMMSFAEVAQQINAAIPLTKPRLGPPPSIGEWIAGVSENNTVKRRWWNGRYWSVYYTKDEKQESQNRDAGRRTDFDVTDIYWRGLAEEPIVVRGAA